MTPEETAYARFVALPDGDPRRGPAYDAWRVEAEREGLEL